MDTCLTRKENPGVSPTQNQRVRGERRDPVGWEPSLPLRVSTGLNSCSETALELSSAAQLAAVSTVSEGSHLPSFTYIRSQ